MQRNLGRKVIATLAAVGVTVGFASTADAGRSHTRAPRLRIINNAEQDADSVVGIFQRGRSNTGYNFQGNLTGQINAASQDADSNANGGDADAGTGSLLSSGPSATADAAAAAAETVTEAIATGGEGGTAEGTNDATQENEATSENAMETGDAESTNEATVEVEQSQDVEITNSIIQDIEAAVATATAGGATASLPVFPDSVSATIINNVDQDADAEVIVAQGADSNTGGNVQGNVTLQGNLLGQEADADANGGDADAYTGGSGTADADGVVVAAASVETVADALGGDGGEATAENTAEQSNSSESSNELVTGDATSENSADVSVGQEQTNDSTNEIEVTVGG